MPIFAATWLIFFWYSLLEVGARDAAVSVSVLFNDFNTQKIY